MNVQSFAPMSLIDSLVQFFRKRERSVVKEADVFTSQIISSNFLF